MYYFYSFVLHFMILLANAFDKLGREEFFCRNNQSIPLKNFCDGSVECGDGSDEIYHNVAYAPPIGWQRCYNVDWRVAGPCLVHDDSIRGKNPSCDRFCDRKLETHYRCQDGSCVPRSTICNGVPCDGCKEDHGWRNGVGFKCRREGRECVLPQQLLHDDISDCDGGVDLCFGFKFPLNATSRGQKQSLDNLHQSKCFQCLNDSVLIPTARVCDDVIDCADLSDECLCEGKNNPKICDEVILLGQISIEKNRTFEGRVFSDGVVSQMLPVKNAQCGTGSLECDRGKCISRTQVCDGVKDCENDEKFDYCQGTIRCWDSTRLEKVCRCEISSSRQDVCLANYGTACNSIADCPPYRQKWGAQVTEVNTWPYDECYSCFFTGNTDFQCRITYTESVGVPLWRFTCNAFSGYLLKIKDYLPQQSADQEKVCNGSEHCSAGETEVNCSEHFKCDVAQTGYVTVSITETCVCKNKSDSTSQKLCGKEGFFCKPTKGITISIERKIICDNLLLVCFGLLPFLHRSEKPKGTYCTEGNFYCGNNDPIIVKEILNDDAGFRTLEVGREYPTTEYQIEQRCNGIVDCDAGNDERNCDAKRFRCDPVQKGYVSIPNDQICDGTINCKDGSDETQERCNSTRFPCESLGGEKVNIDKSLVCDRVINCDDGSDEMNCSDGRFYCENEDPLFIRGRQKFDGRRDCTDWSDECPILNQTGAKNVFSSRYEMIANPILRALVWIMGILSICGNGMVVFVEVRSLRNSKNPKPAAVANRLLILNLAISDGLMGVYLIALGIAGLTMQGRYCSQDHLWRSGTTCTTLGILSVISSETSVMSMLFLTCCRLHAVLNPLASLYRPKKKIVYLMMLSTWALSFTIALLPLVPNLSGNFATQAQLEHNPFVRSVPTSLDDGRKLFATLLTYDIKPNVALPAGFSVDNLSWRQLESFAGEFLQHHHFGIKRSFGYYSTDSVCIPKFFVSRSDPSWGFSFFVNLFNFCAFMFVALAHLTIYLRSSKEAEIRTSRDDKGARVLQRKILRLIITDFCCWIPICVMAFAKLGGADVSNLAYVFAAIVLLPINSALNPLLYSSLPDILYGRIARKFKRVKETSTEMESMNTATGSASGRRDVDSQALQKQASNI